MSKIKIYNLRIVPPEPVYSEVLAFKNEFIDCFGTRPLSKSKPHITLAVFEMDTQYETLLVEAFQKLSILRKFELQLTGFGVFERYAPVLLLKLAESEAVFHIHTVIKSIWQQDLRRKLNSIQVSSPPHITISKTLGKEQLHTSLTYFTSHYSYKKTMAVDAIQLVARPYGNTWDWEHIYKLS